MSFFTPADAEYLKTMIQKVEDLSYETAPGSPGPTEQELKDVKARLFSFIDGCTAENRGAPTER